MRQRIAFPIIAATLSASTALYAQPVYKETIPMQTPQVAQPQLPPEVLKYIKGPVIEAKQFDFLIGDWDVEATRFKEDGTPLLKYKAEWIATYLNDGRMIMDDFKALAPSGQAVSSFVTLRTYSEVTNRWEITGLQALQPSMPSEWYGVAKDGEMLLDATAKTPTGDIVKTKIRFFNIAPDSFSWESAMSFDQGKNWRKAAALKASRKRKTNA